MPQPTPRPHSVAMVAEATGQTRRTVINHIASGELNAVKLGPNTGAWIIPAEDAQAYIAAHTQADVA